MRAKQGISTSEQLFHAGEIGPCELVRGELILMTPAGPDHGDFANELQYRLTQHVKAHRLGKVYSADTGFCLRRNPDTVRAPDVAFVRAARVRPHGTCGFFEGAPDLAAEVLSPCDQAGDFQARICDYLTSGTRMIWVVDPRCQTIACYVPGDGPRWLRGRDHLLGASVVPQFDLFVDEYFAAVQE